MWSGSSMTRHAPEPRTSGTATSASARHRRWNPYSAPVEVPEIGGDTLWADMTAAYEGLPEDVRDRIDGLTALHEIPAVAEDAEGEVAKNIRAARARMKPVEHPVVRTHPDTGRKILYVNAVFTTAIAGVSEAESNSLLDTLFRQVNIPSTKSVSSGSPGRSPSETTARRNTTRSAITTPTSASWNASPSSTTAPSDSHTPRIRACGNSVGRRDIIPPLTAAMTPRQGKGHRQDQDRLCARAATLSAYSELRLYDGRRLSHHKASTVPATDTSRTAGITQHRGSDRESGMTKLRSATAGKDEVMRDAPGTGTSRRRRLRHGPQSAGPRRSGSHHQGRHGYVVVDAEDRLGEHREQVPVSRRNNSIASHPDTLTLPVATALRTGGRGTGLRAA